MPQADKSEKISRESHVSPVPGIFTCPNFAPEFKIVQKKMEIITIESSAFKELTEQIKEIASHIRKMTVREVKMDEMLTSFEAANLLRVSRRTLQRLRRNRTIGYTYAGNACRYRRSDIERYLSERQSERNNRYVPRSGKEAKNGST